MREREGERHGTELAFGTVRLSGRISAFIHAVDVAVGDPAVVRLQEHIPEGVRRGKKAFVVREFPCLPVQGDRVAFPLDHFE